MNVYNIVHMYLQKAIKVLRSTQSIPILILNKIVQGQCPANVSHCIFEVMSYKIDE